MSTPTSNPPPNAVSTPVAAVDDAIFRFWTEFVGKQLAGGRTDVGRMLEAALGFFFERSMQGSKTDERRCAQLEAFLKAVRQEIARTETTLSQYPAEAALATPFQGVQMTLKENDLTHPVLTMPLPHQATTVGQLRAYQTGLKKQADHATRFLQTLTNKLVESRNMVTQRLKVLSPVLYERGNKMVADAQLTHRGGSLASTPAPQSLALVDAPPTNRWTTLSQGAFTRATALHLEAAQATAGMWLNLVRLFVSMGAGAQKFVSWFGSRAAALGQAPAVKTPPPLQPSVVEDARFKPYAEMAERWMRSKD